MPKCRSCDAMIAFQKTENGKMMPVEPGVITVLTKEGKTVQGFIPHWPKCPGADKHRKPKK